MKKKSEWGGRRNGAGRPLIKDKPKRRHNVTLDESTVEYLRKVGCGNLSAGIEIAAEFHKSHSS
jgi:hypothetical protein